MTKKILFNYLERLIGVKMEYAAKHQNVHKSPSQKGQSFFGQKTEPLFFAPIRIQPRLAIGPVDDPYEREADAMADKVMRMSDAEVLQAKSSPVVIQRKCAACAEEEKWQSKSGDPGIQRSPENESSVDQKPEGWDENNPPYLKIQVTMPSAQPGNATDMANYGEANMELIQRGIINPAQYTIPYAALWNNNYQLSTSWRLGNITRNLYDKGDALLKPIRGLVNKIPLAGGFISSKIKLDKPDLKGADWDRYVADKLSLTGLGGAVDRDNPAYNAGSGFTFTVNVVDIPFDENNIVKKIFRKQANKNSIPGSINVNRKCDHCEEEENLQLKRESDASEGAIAPGVVNDVINSSGQPLDKETKSFMGSRFGYDFENVQIHNDSQAHQSSAAINALAYTHGNHIVFAARQYQPGTGIGKHLLAHELTHVLQQNRNSNKPGKNDSSLEINNGRVPGRADNKILPVTEDASSVQRKKACNFYVHDSTESTAIGTGWFLAAHSLAKFAWGGYRIPSGDSIEEMMYRIINAYATEDCDCIEEIQFLSHGSAGNGMYISKTGDEFTIGDFNIPDLDKFGDGPRGTPEYNAWYNKLTVRQRRLVLLRRLICDEDAEIYYRSCQAFYGKTGQDFAQASAAFWRSKVVGHTKVIALSQPGQKTLRPGEKPYWSETEGSETPSPKKPIGIGADQKPKKN